MGTFGLGVANLASPTTGAVDIAAMLTGSLGALAVLLPRIQAALEGGPDEPLEHFDTVTVR